MKKSIIYGMIASISMISATAYADPVSDDATAALTTKGYVDSGLKYVYDVATGASNGAVSAIQTALDDGNGNLIDVSTIQDEIGNYSDTANNIQASGLKGDIEALDDAIGTATSGNTPGTGLTGRVEDLEDQVGTGSLSTQSQTLTGAVNELKDTIDTLDSLGTDNLDPNKKYILQTDANSEGSWSEIAIEDSWSNIAFETNVLGNGN